MKKRIRMLTLVVHATALLVALAAALVVVGIFNESLDWDLFGPKLEAILIGVFGGSIALASAGVALTVVLGIQEIVRAFRALPKAKGADEADAAPEATRWGYARAMVGILAGFAVLIGALALATGACWRTARRRSGGSRPSRSGISNPSWPSGSGRWARRRKAPWTRKSTT